MVNYQNGKIYSIRTYQNDDIYIGSTTETLSARIGSHRTTYKRWLRGTRKYNITSFEILKYDDCYIELLEKYPCNSKEELTKREGELIRKMKCVNKRIEGRTKKEWYEDNKDMIMLRSKKWRENNKEKARETYRKYYSKNKNMIREKQDKRIECGCGGHYIWHHKSRHKRSIKHKEWLLSCHNIFNHL